MYTQINRQLEEAQQGIFHLQKIDSMLKHLRREQYSLEEKVVELKKKLDKENLDVQKLEKKSLSLLFYSVLGNIQERADKERQEALAAKLSYEQAVRDLEEVKSEIFRLYSQRDQYADSQQRYDSLYAQKKEMLLGSGSETAEAILAASNQVAQGKNRIKEIREAYGAGQDVINCLDNALSSLGSAKNWGVWDVMGGGLLADLAKHSHIDDAKAQAQRAQTLLRRFNAELADVHISGHFSFETGGFAKFADFFFDGLIADFVMQSRINNSRESIGRVRGQVQSVLSKLREMEIQEIAAVKELERTIDQLVVER